MAKRERDIGLMDILVQQRITNRLLAALLTRDQQALIDALEGLEATDEEIAQVVGTTAATVCTTRNRIKAKKARGDKVLRDRPQGAGADGVGAGEHDLDVRGVEQG